jgi:hypothetical protein
VLPIPGEVLVKKGDLVKSDTVIAKTFVTGSSYLVNVASHLSVSEKDLEYYMLKKQGDKVSKDEVIALHKAFFGLFKSSCCSPVDGEIEFISTLTGQVSIREPPKVLEVNAYIPGKVIKVIAEKGAIIETPAAFVQGIFGVGGEKYGELMVIAPHDKPLTSDLIKSECSDKILVGGSCVDYETLSKAMQVGAVGVIVGGIKREDLTRFLGYDIGVAITGHENIPTTLIVTEGFGDMEMARKTFELLEAFNGREASINGATQIRAGVIRPEVVIPLQHGKNKKQNVERKDISEGIAPGARVRIIRDPLFGSIGIVTSIPKGYYRIETGSDVRVLEVELENGKRVMIPRANLETIEE